MTAQKWVLWSLQRSDGSGLEVGQGTEAQMTAAAARRTETAARLNVDGAVFVAKPRGVRPTAGDIPPLPGPPASQRTAEDVTEAVIRVACAGDRGPASRARTAAAVRGLVDEGYRLVREDERARARKPLAAAWSAWLDLMMSTDLPGYPGRSLLRDVLDLEPGLRERFETAFLGRDGG